MWSNTAVGVPSFFSIFDFRISGTSKTVFGDGIAIWIVKDGFYAHTGQHGFTQDFYGVGVIFDTFRNTEHPHKDVAIVVNDKTRTWESMMQSVNGCDGAMRYYAGPETRFSINDKSRAKIYMNDTHIGLQVDLKNSGRWEECALVTLEGLSEDWLRHAHIGVTASTGQLSDNHDVMSLQSFSSFRAMEVFDREDSGIGEGAKYFRGSENLNLLDRLTKIESAVGFLLDHVVQLDHQLEHKFGSVGSTFENIQERIENQALEITSTRYHDDYYGPGLDHTDAVARSQLEKLQSRVEDMSNLAKVPHHDSWRLPFFILLVVLVALAVGLHLFYRRLRKIHIL